MVKHPDCWQQGKTVRLMTKRGYNLGETAAALFLTMSGHMVSLSSCMSTPKGLLSAAPTVDCENRRSLPKPRHLLRFYSDKLSCMHALALRGRAVQRLRRGSCLGYVVKE